MKNEVQGSELWPIWGLLLMILFWLAFGEQWDGYLRGFLWELARFELAFPEALWRLFFCESLWQEAQAILQGTEMPDWHRLLLLLRLASEPFGRLGALVIMLLLWLSQRLSVRERFAQTHSMQSLLARNVQSHPCLAPILNWGGSLLQEDVDSGPWMCARQPLQFAVENGLLRDARQGCVVSAKALLTDAHLADPASCLHGGEKLLLDRAKARACFAAQLGPKFPGFARLPPYLLALALAFALFGLDQKGPSRKLLNQLSLSFRPSRPARALTWSLRPPFLRLPRQACPFRIAAGLPMSFEAVQALFARKELASVIRPHNRYTHLLLYALFAFARRRGILTCAEMIWLKPVNRPLFYLLNNYGRRTAWVEACGALTHYRAEEGLAQQMPDFCGSDLEEPCVEEAVHGLAQALYDEGWICEAL